VILDQKRLESLNVNGLDLVLLLMNVTVEIVAATSASSQDADENLIKIANGLEGFARRVKETRTQFLISELARALISTESAS
jgi:hypothetical protein